MTPARLRALRQRLGLTQREFAERYGVPLRTLEAWEQGRFPMDNVTTGFLLMIENAPRRAAQVLAKQQATPNEPAAAPARMGRPRKPDQ